MKNFTAVFEPEEGGYICWLEEIPEAMSQGETLKEAKANLLDAVKLLMEVNRERAEASVQGLRVRRALIPIEAI